MVLIAITERAANIVDIMVPITMLFLIMFMMMIRVVMIRRADDITIAMFHDTIVRPFLFVIMMMARWRYRVIPILMVFVITRNFTIVGSVSMIP